MFKHTVDDVIIFNPKDYSHNLFWQTNETSQQKVYSIISNYLSSMNKSDILQLHMKNIIRIKGFKASVQYDPDSKMFRGEFPGLGDSRADFCAENIKDLQRAGEKSLEVFLEMICLNSQGRW